jgi:hypothetical protein
MTAHQTARRFFWAWLIGAAAVSSAGVMTHAMLGDARSPVIASALAVIIVAIQLAATYSVHVLVRAQITGAVYRCAVASAVVLALGAFVLNALALRDLAVTWAGTAASIAWVVPIIVDLGMTASTIALLALASDSPSAVHVELHNTVHNVVRADAHLATARRLVAQGLVRIAPERVAQVLEAHAAGAAPSAIQRRLKVGYSTVQRIIAHHDLGGAS